MLNVIRERVILIGAAVAAGLAFYAASGDFGGAAIGSLLTGPAPAGTAVLRFAGASVAAVIVAGIAAGFTGRLWAPVVLGSGLSFAAVKAGSIDPWLRGIGGSGDYWILAGEAAIWGAWVVLSCRGAWAVADAIRRWMKGDEAGEPPATMNVELVRELSKATGLGAGTVEVMTGLVLAGVIAAVVGPMVAVSALPGQVTAAAAAAGLVGGLVARQVVPGGRGLGILLGPVACGIGWYGWIAMSGWSRRAMLEHYFQTPTGMWHAGLALPIYWAGAGAGLGMIWAEAMMGGGATEPQQAGSGRGGA